MYGLYSVDPENTKNQIVHAFSYDIKSLVQMKLIVVELKQQKYYISKPIKVYRYNKSSKEQGHLKEVENEEEYNLIEDEQCYGYNYDNKKTDMIDQVIIIISEENRTYLRMKIHECDISVNPIIIDMYYREGILNS
jgi:hypothetical protein